MINFKPVLAAAVIALAAPLIATPSFAQGTKTMGAPGGGGGGGGGHIGGGGGGHMGGGGGGHFGGHMGGGGRHMAGGGWHGGGGWRGGHGGWRGHHHHGGFYSGFYPGFAFGVGSAFASPYYYDDDYYGYYDGGPDVEVVPGGGDAVAYCQRRYRSYDVRSGTYLGYDGLRHPCP